MNRIILFLLLLFPGLLVAQTFPEHPNSFVNDYAKLLSEKSKEALIDQLKSLKSETGIEATILTIDSRKSYGHRGSEQFATDLFNAWGIGDADQNNGILILIEREERAMRIELGEGYGRDYDLVAGDVIDQSFVPSFRKDNYDLGIVKGTEDVLLRIARPFAAGKPAQKAPKSA